MTIDNATIIKAARAAGLDVQPCLVTGKPAILDMKGGATFFDPLNNDSDNALIRRGAEIDVEFWWESKDHPASVEATAWVRQKNGDMQDIAIDVPSGTDKAQAERNAVILCAAAKWDAQGEKA